MSNVIRKGNLYLDKAGFERCCGLHIFGEVKSIQSTFYGFFLCSIGTLRE